MFNTVSNNEMKTVQESRGLQKAHGKSLKNHSSSHAVAVHTTPGRIENGGVFTLKRHQIFSVHTTLECLDGRPNRRNGCVFIFSRRGVNEASECT